MKTIELLKKLEGLQTIPALANRWNISRAKAIYYIHRLRKNGYVKTFYNYDKTRVYEISAVNAAGGTNYIKVINEYSPLKLESDEVYQIYGKKISIEEVLIFALKKRDIRYITALLILFRKIKNWSELYNLAKEENLLPEVCALYDVARLNIHKIKKMPLRFRRLSLNKTGGKYEYIVPGIKSRDFKEIERKWRVYIPLNKADLEDYR